MNADISCNREKATGNCHEHSEPPRKKIVLLTINAKWIHPSFALRLLKANLEPRYQAQCEIIELNLRQSLAEKLETVIAARPLVLGISVSIWNHSETIALLQELEKLWGEKPVIILGGPEVSFLPQKAAIFTFADYVIQGEGEEAFGELCALILTGGGKRKNESPVFISGGPVDTGKIKSAYHLYSDEDLTKKLVYVEASRGCPFNCAFCLSSVKTSLNQKVREFPLDNFLREMNGLVKRKAKTFKFLDRTFNSNTKRALKIIAFFLEKIKESKEPPPVVHFEMVPFIFSDELLNALALFPAGTLRLEIGLQTFNTQTASLIGRSCNPKQELETLRFLRENTRAIIHADLIAGLPGEDIYSFANGFDALWEALFTVAPQTTPPKSFAEIQVGMLKLLHGAPIAIRNESHGMCYSQTPPYEALETSAVSAQDIQRLKNFGRFWEMIANRGLAPSLLRDNAEGSADASVFWLFMELSDFLIGRFGRSWGIDKKVLIAAIAEFEESKRGEIWKL